MKNLIAYISDPVPWRGIQLFAIGCMVGLPCFIVLVFFNIDNTVFKSISLTLFLLGMVIIIIGGINHLKYFNKHNKEFTSPERTKQPWER